MKLPILQMKMHVRNVHPEKPLSSRKRNKILNEEISITDTSTDDLSLEELPECPKVTKNSALKDKIKFVCEEDGCAFETLEKTDLQTHVNTSHKEKNEVSLSAQGLKLVCGECRMEFPGETFQFHLKTY